ncbi:MAG: hypothetical protein ACFFD4_05235 [Candidatus Odinarchaeota archaeon]
MQEKLFLYRVVLGWELDNFDPAISHLKAFSKNAGRNYAGTLLRPHVNALEFLKNRELIKDILEAARSLGRQLIKSGSMAAEDLNIVSRELLPLGEFIEEYNKNIQAGLGTPKNLNEN